MKTYLYLSAFISAIIFTSCSTAYHTRIEKRKHIKGIYVSVFNNFFQKKKTETETSNEEKSSKNKISEDNSTQLIIAPITAQLIDQQIINSTAQKEAPSYPTNSNGFYNSSNKNSEFSDEVVSSTPNYKFSPGYKNNKNENSRIWDVSGGGPEGGEGTNTTLALLGLIFSSVGCLLGGCLFSATGTVLSLISLDKIKKDTKTYGGKKMATWGLILGIIGFTLWSIFILLFVLAGG